MPVDVRAAALAIAAEVIADEVRCTRSGGVDRLAALVDLFRRSAETLASELAPRPLAPAVRSSTARAEIEVTRSRLLH